MSFQVKEPVLVIGLGGVGSKLAIKAKNALNLDCLVISNDVKDHSTENISIHVSTGSVINPSVQLIRGSTYSLIDEIKSKISGYSTIILMSNLAGKAGSAMAPVVSEICKDAGIGLVSFAIMPFKYEKDRIFNSGVSLKRIRENSQCTVVLDNDSLLESNPELSPKACYEIANSAILHVVESLSSSDIVKDTSIITTSKEGQNIEDSLRDSLKMLYGNAPPNSVKRSMLYVVGGNNIPVGILNSITKITAGILDESNSQIDMSSTADESKVVMLSSIQGMTKFDGYDPLGIIPQENTLDWSTPDCSIDCKLELYQLE
ncbi:MAG: cell division protein FtsZ [Nitrosopumilus sp.]|nr:cell division protein FtsZ [Nitrosopumilus sp.]MDH3489511.1 cell division protein FtsZ [Nitrosopumilus sp.]MDH3516509.1 cell division protein FtsZ [Nitrosopumilus sp.]MDH3564975.1 cell division protein FtsZ [Nitrosopumilus sp.]MDH5416398.1 cell division protein FtsZ [Nitrosopumilus sp.]